MVDPGVPEEGYYRRRLVKGGPWVAVKIWNGPPRDPDTGEVLFERPYLWRALLNGDDVDIWDVWPECSGEPIGYVEYEFILKAHLWAKVHAPNDPEANPRKPIDLHKQKPIF